MKKVCLTLMMLAFMVVGAHAQAVIGVKGGFSYHSLVGSDVDDDAEGMTGFHIGGMTSFELTESVQLRPELLFSYYMDEKYSESWITVPVMGTVFLTENINLQFGPYLGFLTTASYDGTSAKEGRNSFDAGLSVGAGYELESGLNFTARYNYGLLSPFEDSTEEVDTDGDGVPDSTITIKASDASVYNGVFQLSVGYFFNR